jgi:sRNA-binding protein
MSYEDIVEAQAKRDAKEAAVVKGKPGRKRKCSAPVAAQAKRARKSEMEVAVNEIEALGLGNHCSVLRLS